MFSIFSAVHNDYLFAISQLRLIDDDFMNVVFKDKDCLELLLSLIFNEHIEIVSYENQYPFKNLHGRDIQIDVLIKTEAHHYINVEVQRQSQGAIPQRARYHQSLIDSYVFKKGKRWNEIPSVTVIFITEEDVLKKGLPIYHIDRVIKETGDKFKDGTQIIYVNASIQEESHLGRLMHDFMCEKAEDMYYEVLRNKVKYYKENQEGRREMCEIMDNIRNMGRNEGRLEGLAEGKIVGLAEGKMNTLINTLVQLLKQKLGSLTPEIELQIQKSTEEQLNQLTIHIFDVENEEDIVNVLSC